MSVGRSARWRVSLMHNPSAVARWPGRDVIDWSSEWPQLTCSECGEQFTLSERNTRGWLRGEKKGQPVCPTCRDLKAVGPPGPKHYAWLESLPADRLDRLLRQASLLRA